MSLESRRGDMENSTLVQTTQRPYVFLDYGGLIMDYQFTRNTLLRAHNMALESINSLRTSPIRLEELQQAHKRTIQEYLTDRKENLVEWSLDKIMGRMRCYLELGYRDLSAGSLKQIYEFNDHDTSPMPTTLETVPKLREIVKLGIISNLPHGSIYHELSRYGFRGVFYPIVVSYQVGYRKPHPAIYKEALKRANLTDPNESIFFSHDQEEVDGALAVGMQSHLVRNLAEVVTKLQAHSQ